MELRQHTLLWVTDLYYEAKGRHYYEEDLFLTSHLRQYFRIILCHPEDTEPFEHTANLIVFRNAGPVAPYQDQYEAFRQRIQAQQLKTYNSLDGHADMNGKSYLLELTAAQYPVIPTIDHLEQLHRLPDSKEYIIKPFDGADSHGVQRVSADHFQQALAACDQRMLIQPYIPFEYEVSFYYIDHEFQYALYAPDPQQRWKMELYDPQPSDFAFAEQFIRWNHISCGIQRVDACRTASGELLLVELEDLNPYLSLLDIPVNYSRRFISRMIQSLEQAIKA
ncbi:hypothetical protein [Paenibacillus bovis]|uniref:ATP-grasp domain-containing protein n=1 Tax=Paenibacillus bovis TaxID=1616788 RepID=A0A172ZEG7_9BACL|nr:hypothetical protein [Paenibacillus bovis]ANF95667.1 hypothetical protein AR543_06420 [Paenibacillus bovis]